MKMQIYIRDIDSFLRGDFGGCFAVMANRLMDGCDDWVHLQEIDIDPTKADIPGMTTKALNIIDREVAKARAELAEKLALLETKRQEFLALTHIEGE